MLTVRNSGTEDPPNFRKVQGIHTANCLECAHMKMYKERFTCTKYVCFVLAGTECASFKPSYGVSEPLGAEVRRMLKLRGVKEVPSLKGNSTHMEF